MVFLGKDHGTLVSRVSVRVNNILTQTRLLRPPGSWCTKTSAAGFLPETAAPKQEIQVEDTQGPRSGQAQSHSRRADWIIRDVDHPALGCEEKSVLYALASRMPTLDAEVWPSLPTIASNAGVSESVAGGVMRWLRAVGILVEVNVDRPSKTYRVNFDRLCAMPHDVERRCKGKSKVKKASAADAAFGDDTAQDGSGAQHHSTVVPEQRQGWCPAPAKSKSEAVKFKEEKSAPPATQAEGSSPHEASPPEPPASYVAPRPEATRQAPTAPLDALPSPEPHKPLGTVDDACEAWYLERGDLIAETAAGRLQALVTKGTVQPAIAAALYREIDGRRLELGQAAAHLDVNNLGERETAACAREWTDKIAPKHRTTRCDAAVSQIVEFLNGKIGHVDKWRRAHYARPVKRQARQPQAAGWY